MNAKNDTVLSVSIQPREEDRELARQQVLLELADNTPTCDIVDILIEKQQIIIQAKRLRDKTLDLIKDHGEKCQHDH